MKVLIGILVFIVSIPVFAVVGFVAMVGYTSWGWLPIIFELNNWFGGYGLGLAIGLIALAITMYVQYKLEAE